MYNLAIYNVQFMYNGTNLHLCPCKLPNGYIVNKL